MKFFYLIIIFIIFLLAPQIAFAEPEFNPDPSGGIGFRGIDYEGIEYEPIYINIFVTDKNSCACQECDSCIIDFSAYDYYGCAFDLNSTPLYEWPDPEEPHISSAIVIDGTMTCPMIDDSAQYHSPVIDVGYYDYCEIVWDEDGYYDCLSDCADSCASDSDDECYEDCMWVCYEDYGWEECYDAYPPASRTYYANLAPEPSFYDMEPCTAYYEFSEWYVDIDFNFEDTLDENLYDIQDATMSFDEGIGDCTCYPDFGFFTPKCLCNVLAQDIEDAYYRPHSPPYGWLDADITLEITDEYSLTESITNTYDGYKWAYYWSDCEYNEYPGDDDCETTCPDYCDTGSDPDVAYSDGYRSGDPDSYCECMYNIETSCPYGCDGDICNTSPPDPVVDLKADGSDGPITILSGTSATLSWTSANVASCTASGDWSGEKALSGSESTGSLVSSKTYVLACDAVSDSVTVNVNQEPIAGASAEGQCSYPPERIPGTSISLETNNAGCLSQDPDGQIIRFDWDFQDGNTYSCCNSGCNKKITGNNCNTNHTYTSSGLFVAELKVTDDDGAQIIDTLTIEICSPACENDGDCQDGYICNNPGTCAAICTEEPVPLIIKWWREIIPFIFE